MPIRLIFSRTLFAVLLVAGLLFSGCAGEPRPWNVVLFTFDTTRADFLGCYGKEDARTPYLDRFAEEGFLFENAITSNPVTQAAHATILTGTWPMLHGVRDNMLFRLPEERNTIAEILRSKGYATGAAIGAFPLVRSFGCDQGFEFYDDEITTVRLDHRGRAAQRRNRTWYEERPAGHVNDAILPWLRRHFRDGGDSDRPFFAWLHYWDPHEPHIAPAPYDQLFAHDPYQGEIAYADRSFGAILEVLEKAGELERTVIVMVADHGESRMDHHEATHAFLAYDSTVHVPLIIRVPDQPETAGRRIAQRVGTVDIVPTVLDLLGFEIPDDIQGHSLAPLMLNAGLPPEVERTYYAESLSPRLSHGIGELRALYSGPFKYIHGPRPELFNLDQDPAEVDDLGVDLPEERQRLENSLQDFVIDHSGIEAAAAVHTVGDETRVKLEALGYLSSSDEESAVVTEVLTMEGAAPQDRVGDINLMARLRQELGTGRFHLAKITARELLRIEPENTFFQGRLAAAYLGLGQIEEAASVIDASADIGGANQADFFRVAQALFDEGHQERGLAMALRLEDESESVQGRLLLAKMYLDRGATEDHERQLEWALDLDPQHHGARLMQAQHLADIGNLQGAEEQYLQLIAEFPVDPQAQVGYARVLRECGRGNEALPRLQRVLRLTPHSCEARLEYLLILIDLGGGDDADDAFRDLQERCREEQFLAAAADAMAGLDVPSRIVGAKSPRGDQ